MCIAVPLRVVQRLDDDRALVEQDGIAREVNIRLTPGVVPGDYVLINLGVAVQKLTEEEAQGVLDLWEQITRVLLDEDLEELREEHE